MVVKGNETIFYDGTTIQKLVPSLLPAALRVDTTFQRNEDPASLSIPRYTVSQQHSILLSDGVMSIWRSEISGY